MSLRDAAAWAEIDEIAEVSDVALLNRLRKAAVWLGQIVGSILSARMGPAGNQTALASGRRNHPVLSGEPLDGLARACELHARAPAAD